MFFVTDIEQHHGVLPLSIPDDFTPTGIDGNKVTLSNVNGEESFVTIPAWEGQSCRVKEVVTESCRFHIIEMDQNGDRQLRCTVEGGGGYWWLSVYADPPAQDC